MKDQNHIEPPEGWELHSPHGFMGSTEGKLVRLADVVHWLMRTRECPLAEAVEAVTAAIERAGTDGLYCIDQLNRARAYGPPSAWDQFAHTKEEMAFGLDAAKVRKLARMLRAAWIANPLDQASFDPDRIDHGDPTTQYAITHVRAHALWGWGTKSQPTVQSVEPDQITTYSALKAFRASNLGAPWTNNMKAVLAAEERRRKESPGARRVRKTMGKELGVTDKRIGQLIRGYQQTQRQRPATPLRAVGAG